VSGAVFDEFDFDGSGEVTRTEFIKYVLRDALAASAQQVMNLFRQFDQDGSGKIDKAEFRKVMGLLGFDIQYDDLNRVFDDRSEASIFVHHALQPGVVRVCNPDVAVRCCERSRGLIKATK
jgi:Ca2+-binding EF-hand superfamily protein